MKRNMGTTDKMLRVLLAVIIAILYLTNIISGTPGIVLIIFALVFVLTSFVSFCPLYVPFGWNTMRKINKKKY
jgi:hypothetical protein